MGGAFPEATTAELHPETAVNYVYVCLHNKGLGAHQLNLCGELCIQVVLFDLIDQLFFNPVPKHSAETKYPVNLNVFFSQPLATTYT